LKSKTKAELISEHFNIFPVSTRDQLIKLYFDGDMNKLRHANLVLLRLREKNLLKADTSRQPYIYYSVNTKFRWSSAKLEHQLAIVNFYIWLVTYKKEPVEILGCEVGFGQGFPRPDLVLVYRGEIRFVEVQRSRISEKEFAKKIKGYERLYVEGKHRMFTNDKPIVWVITPQPYHIQARIPVKQTIIRLENI
jgi:hypothetical protein